MSNKVLIITGFGAFANVTDNPTQQIVHELETTLPSITITHSSNGVSETIDIVYYLLEVSVDYCESFLTQIQLQHTGKELYFIHLGVDCNGETIKLEQYAYNNKTFRVPDYRGYQPQEENIELGFSFNEPLPTTWNIPRILQTIQEKIQKENTVNNYLLKPSYVTISNDPGRYLCNYIYYRSLCQHPTLKPPSASSTSERFSIFVHVPEFVIIPKEAQINMIKLIIETLLTEI